LDKEIRLMTEQERPVKTYLSADDPPEEWVRSFRHFGSRPCITGHVLPQNNPVDIEENLETPKLEAWKDTFCENLRNVKVSDYIGLYEPRKS